jgi:uncharacterized protein with HEPN domain
MSEMRDSLLFLEDITESLSKINRYIKGMEYSDLAKDEKTVDALIRNLEIIGEAVKNIPDAIRKKYPEVEWKEAAALRDVLIHDYFGVDLESLWDTIHNNLPEFGKKISLVYQKESS